MKYLALFVLLSLNSCTVKNKSITDEILGKTIIFPSDVSVLSFSRDSLLSFNSHHSGYAIVSYTDTTQCLSCDIQLYKWNRFIKEANKMFKGKVVCFLLFRHENARDVYYLLQKHNFLYPVYIDYNGSFFKQNKLSSKRVLQTFLIDKENKIIAYGNPIYDERIEEEYLNIISTN